MYQYNHYDREIISARVKQFRDQTRRYIEGKLSEEEFRPLRLQNGLYIQRLAPMLRIAIPYGTLSANQMRCLAKITRDFDKGYAHFSTRQNLQLNWPQLREVPDILEQLATVEMHAVQTSGNCIRNITTDQFAGCAVDELCDPRPYCELLRQWACFHPEFAYLPRKFKIAVNASTTDRAAIAVHDIGLNIVQNSQGEVGFEVFVGGGLGRTPAIGAKVREFLPEVHLLSYLEAILRIYNLYGRRDNRHKARIKILVKALGQEEFTRQVEAEWQHLRDGPATLTEEEIARVKGYFVPSSIETIETEQAAQEHRELEMQGTQSAAFNRWLTTNTEAHKAAGYRLITLTLKATGNAPGDINDDIMDQVAQLAEDYSGGEIRATHEQNLVLPQVRVPKLQELWHKLQAIGLATPNNGLLTDIICCPGGDFCSLANARSIPIAETIQRHFDDLDFLHDLGPLDLNISGCMNACGHHHVGHIGILGVDKRNQEFYQVQLGGSQSNPPSLAKVIGPSFSKDEIGNVINTIIKVYVEKREGDETFFDTCQRLGIEPFKQRVYAKTD